VPANNTTIATGATHPGSPPEPEDASEPPATWATGPAARVVGVSPEPPFFRFFDDPSWCDLSCPRPDRFPVVVADAGPEPGVAVDPGSVGAGDDGPDPGEPDVCEPPDDGELGRVLGEADGDDVPWAVGATRGFAWLVWPCHESATYPPSGTLSEVTPTEEYFHSPDFPSDHHSDQ
jgi:hypothetical protein